MTILSNFPGIYLLRNTSETKRSTSQTNFNQNNNCSNRPFSNYQNVRSIFFPILEISSALVLKCCRDCKNPVIKLCNVNQFQNNGKDLKARKKSKSKKERKLTMKEETNVPSKKREKKGKDKEEGRNEGT